MAKKREYPAWCIWCPDIGPMFATFAKTQVGAIDAVAGVGLDVESLDERRAEWRKFQRDGYRCVRVVIVEKGVKRG